MVAWALPTLFYKGNRMKIQITFESTKNWISFVLTIITLYMIFGGHFLEISGNKTESGDKKQEAEQFIANVAHTLHAKTWETGVTKSYTATSWLFAKYSINLDGCIKKDDFIQAIKQNNAIVYYPNFYTLEICKGNIHFFYIEPSHINNHGEYCNNITFWIEWKRSKQQQDYCQSKQ